MENREGTQRKRRRISLKWGLLTTVLLCWVVPIATVMTAAGFLLNTYYERNINKVVETGAANALEQMELRFGTALEASKAVSYEGEVRAAYRQYQKDGSTVRLYSAVKDYLSRSFSRDENFKAVYITFLNQPEAIYGYVTPRGGGSFRLYETYRDQVRAEAMAIAEGMDTGIYFLEREGELYMVRNLMDSQFQPYAVLVMHCDAENIFQSLDTIASLTSARVAIDSAVMELWPEETDSAGGRDAEEMVLEYTAEVQGHTLVLTAGAMRLSLWGSLPELSWMAALILLLVLPILLVIVVLFYRHVTRPLETLEAAAEQVKAGQRGYVVEEQAPNREFDKLTQNFNSMSLELKTQFDRLYEEQQSLQQARIKALQSQINPHFLGNTLEIINWEARLAENDKVSAMIEALSTMLDAAIGRDGRPQIPLREELGYVDAYLYIINERLGGSLTVVKEVDRELEEALIPRLVLQPLVENAVEHDIAKRRGSELCLRAYRQGGDICLDVEHEGAISPEDRKNIDKLLAPLPPGESAQGHVGIRNVNQRIRLLYGERGRLTIQEVSPGRIRAQVVLPVQGGRPQEGAKNGKAGP